MTAGRSARIQPSASVISQSPLSVEIRVRAPISSAATAHCQSGARRIASTAKATIDRISSAQTMHISPRPERLQEKLCNFSGLKA